MKQYEVEVDMHMPGEMETYYYNSKEEAMVGAKAISLLAMETRVYSERHTIVARFVRGKQHSFSDKRSYKYNEDMLEDPDNKGAIDPEIYGVINLGNLGKNSLSTKEKPCLGTRTHLIQVNWLK